MKKMTVLTTLHFLFNLQTVLISCSVCSRQALTVKFNKTLLLMLLIRKLRRKQSVVNMTVLTTLHFLFNLQTGLISCSVCSRQALTVKFNKTLLPMLPIRKLWRKQSVVNMTVFTTLHFLFNLQTRLLSCSVCPRQALTVKFNKTLLLMLPIRKLQRKQSVVNMAVFTTLHFLFNLQTGLISCSVCPRQALTVKFNKTL